MIWSSRIAAIALAILTVLGAILWVDLSSRYLAASEARVALWHNVAYEDIRIPLISSNDQLVTIGVLFRVTNPTSIGVEVLSLSYEFYMDDLLDPRPFFEKSRDIFIGVGGYYAAETGTLVAPHSDGFVWANLTVYGAAQPDTIERLNLTFNGRYYPILNGWMVYRVAGTSVKDRVLGISFLPPPSGVAPLGA